MTTTEDHPRGPAVVVENWHEPLIAFAWQTLLIATSAVAGFGTEWAAAGAGFSFGQALAGWLLTLVTALAVEAKVWAPLGVSEAVKRMGV